jgi:hypothetical protein
VLQSVFTPENLTIDAFLLGRITSESWRVHKSAQQMKLLTCIWRVDQILGRSQTVWTEVFGIFVTTCKYQDNIGKEA